MNIVNGGYAKIQKQLYWVVLRFDNGNCGGCFQHTATRRDAIARTFRHWNEKAKVDHVEVEGENMTSDTLEQAQDWLHQRGGYAPKRGLYATRNESFGPF